VSCEGFLNPYETSKPSKFRPYWILILDMKDVKLVKLVQGFCGSGCTRENPLSDPRSRSPSHPPHKQHVNAIYPLNINKFHKFNM
jgi:hypothetical protein